MYTYIHVCIYTYTNVHTYTYIYIHIYTRINVYTYACVWNVYRVVYVRSWDKAGCEACRMGAESWTDLVVSL